jgi:hypothetical protein
MHKAILTMTVILLGVTGQLNGREPSALAQPKASTTARQPVELFGVPLKHAPRGTLRQALSQAGVQPTRVEDGYWVDLYNPRGILDEATELAVGYVGASSAFAFAKYTFRSFMDTDQVQRIVKLVTTKYGTPTKQAGRYGLGDVRVVWNLAAGMQIEVARGWPDTTTTLTYLDPQAYSRMQAEIDRQQEKSHQNRARAQRKAF